MLIHAGSKLTHVSEKRSHSYNLTNANVAKTMWGRHIAEEDCDVRDSRSDPGDKTWSKLVLNHESEVVIKHEVPLLYNNPH